MNTKTTLNLEEVEASVVAGALAGQCVDFDGGHVTLWCMNHPNAEGEVRVVVRVFGRRDAPRPARARHVPVATTTCRH